LFFKIFKKWAGPIFENDIQFEGQFNFLWIIILFNKTTPYDFFFMLKSIINQVMATENIIKLRKYL